MLASESSSGAPRWFGWNPRCRVWMGFCAALLCPWLRAALTNIRRDLCKQERPALEKIPPRSAAAKGQVRAGQGPGRRRRGSWDRAGKGEQRAGSGVDTGPLGQGGGARPRSLPQPLPRVWGRVPAPPGPPSQEEGDHRPLPGRAGRAFVLLPRRPPRRPYPTPAVLPTSHFPLF